MANKEVANLRQGSPSFKMYLPTYFPYTYLGKFLIIYHAMDGGVIELGCTISYMYSTVYLSRHDVDMPV